MGDSCNRARMRGRAVGAVACRFIADTRVNGFRAGMPARAAFQIPFESLMPLVVSAGLLLLTLAVMHWSAQALARQSVQLFGRRLQLYLFGFPGTVVHEGSHVIACVLFGHRVHRVRWFDPQATDGSLGSVEHSYDASSVYQRAGTIVIGVAPLLAGALILLLAVRHLLGIPLTSLADVARFAELAKLARIEPWRWALFAYVSLSVGGSMHLSGSDLRGAGRGALTLGRWLVIVLLVGAVLWWITSQTVPAFWPEHMAPLLGRTAGVVALGSDTIRRALELSVAVNLSATAVLFVARRIVAAV